MVETRTVTEVERVAEATRVLAAHFPAADRKACLCGAQWHPRHQAEMLAHAGALRP
jgi:hypothetical protein